jgi:hypothetical protein
MNFFVIAASSTRSGGRGLRFSSCKRLATKRSGSSRNADQLARQWRSKRATLARGTPPDIASAPQRKWLSRLHAHPRRIKEGTCWG